MKYPIPVIVKLAVFASIIFGIWIHSSYQNHLIEEIKLTDIEISDYSKYHIEVKYNLTNLSRVDRDIWLILKVFNSTQEELGSTMFQVKARARMEQPMIKLLDKLPRTLKDGEIPEQATINIYKRKVI